MESQPDSLSERVESSFLNLAVLSASLNSASDELGRCVSELDASLKTLNLGVEAWVQIWGDADERDQTHWSESVGYAKIGGKWGISLRSVSENFSEPDLDHVECWLFNEAPRPLRLAALNKIPDLLQSLSKRASETTQQIRSKLDEVRSVVAAVKKAASTGLKLQPPPPGISVGGNGQ